MSTRILAKSGIPVRGNHSLDESAAAGAPAGTYVATGAAPPACNRCQRDRVLRIDPKRHKAQKSGWKINDDYTTTANKSKNPQITNNTKNTKYELWN